MSEVKEDLPGLGRELTEDEKQALAAQQMQQVMAQPLVLPLRYQMTSIQLQDGSPALLTEFQTPAGITRLVWDRESGLAFASQMRKQLETGPSKLVVPGGNPGGLLVPR